MDDQYYSDQSATMANNKQVKLNPIVVNQHASKRDIGKGDNDWGFGFNG